MSRRRKSLKRSIDPDYRYNSVSVSRIVNYVMQDGKKSLARKIVYGALDVIKEKSAEKDPLVILEEALANIAPSVEVRSRRIGGTSFQIPTHVSDSRKIMLTIRWLKNAALERKESLMKERLALEILDASVGKGNAIRLKERSHAMAETNRAFSHYR